MKPYNWILIAVVVLLGALPLWWVERPADAEIFGGADDQAKDAIMEIAPAYEPWFEPLIEPASGEIASLLFALQAAIGAGFIGYYIGVGRTREKMRRENMRNDSEAAGNASAQAPAEEQ